MAWTNRVTLREPAWTSSSPSGEQSSMIDDGAAVGAQARPHVDVAVAGGLVETVDEQFPAERPEDFLHARAEHHRHGVRVGRVEDQVGVDRGGLTLRIHELELDVLGDNLCGLRLLHR